MQTNILSFLLFAIIASIVIRLLPHRFKKYGLLCFNILFYLLCDIRYIALMLFSIVWSFCIGRKLSSQTSHTTRRILLWVGIIPVLLTLCFFKYYNFFITDEGHALTILMPLGISYYIFKIISFLADAYRGKSDLAVSFVNYSIYISLFPQIICGPIARFENLSEQIADLNSPSELQLSEGCLLIISGLFKKLVIADRLSTYVNTIFTNSSAYPALALWMAAFYYTIQIYCDFAGYSEISIGITNLLGIKCHSNFNLPYFSYSIKDFWQRWHISLSTWLRDYVYIPLGGNRSGRMRKYLNTLITFLISGLWHGSGFHFVFWGLWHGLLNLLPSKRASRKWQIVLQTFGTFVCVMFGWIFFRADSLNSGFQYIGHMFSNITVNYQSIVATIIPFTGDYSSLPYFLTIMLFIFLLFLLELREFTSFSAKTSKSKYIKHAIYLLSIILFGMIGQNSFLYANF